MKPINLNKVRKERDRKAEKTKADENARKHGQSKAERLLDATRGAQFRARLDAHLFESE